MLTGSRGKILIVYQRAALLGPWSLAKEPVVGELRSFLTAKLTEIDDFWINQKPMTVGLWMGKSWWVWEETKLERNGTNVSGALVGNPTALARF